MPKKSSQAKAKPILYPIEMYRTRILKLIYGLYLEGKSYEEIRLFLQLKSFNFTNSEINDVINHMNLALL